MGRHIMRGFSGSRLTQARDNYADGRGITIAELARLTGVSVPAVHNWERGGAIPQADLLLRVATALGISTPMDALIDIPRDERLLADWRVLFGMLQTEVAKALGVEGAAVSAIERGTRLPTPPQRDKLAQMYGISPDEIMECCTRARSRPLGPTKGT